jgi:hypothetical protein
MDADIPVNIEGRAGRGPVRLILSDDLRRKRLTVGFPGAHPRRPSRHPQRNSR